MKRYMSSTFNKSEIIANLIYYLEVGSMLVVGTRGLEGIIRIVGWVGVAVFFIGIILRLTFNYEQASPIVAAGLVLYTPDFVLTIYEYLKCIES